MWDIESVLFEYKSKIFPYNIPVRKYDLFSFKVGVNSFLVGFIQQYNNLLFIFLNLVSYVYIIVPCCFLICLHYCSMLFSLFSFAHFLQNYSSELKTIGIKDIPFKSSQLWSIFIHPFFASLCIWTSFY